MSSLDETKLQRGLIITDDISPSPILDFDKYRDAIIKIIKESYPKFSIGIYGDWGSGKTTLMQSIYDQLEKENKNKENPIILVWFNAWRYEREEHFTIIPLLKTIESQIPPEQYGGLKKYFIKASISGFQIVKNIVSGVIGNYFGKEAGDFTKEGISDFIERISPGLEELNKLEKTTIYFEGQEKIETELKRLKTKDPNFRIVVFVDDLDRCSPEKVIEVFESIKIFLGLDGFIYVLGLSQKKIAQAINKKYEFNKEEEGDHYIKKIIQIPISLSEWNDDDVKKLLKEFLSKNIIHKNYQKIINNNLDLITKSVENNPREVKRFLNNFIVAYEIFLKNDEKEEDKKAKNLLVIQGIQIRWYSFYHILIKYGFDFCLEIKKYVEISNEERIKQLDSEDKDENFNYDFKIILRNYKSDLELWKFVKEHIDLLTNIKDWTPYRRATESIKDVSPILSTKFPKSSPFEDIPYGSLINYLDELKKIILDLLNSADTFNMLEIIKELEKLLVERKFKENYKIISNKFNELIKEKEQNIDDKILIDPDIKIRIDQLMTKIKINIDNLVKFKKGFQNTGFQMEI